MKRLLCAVLMMVASSPLHATEISAIMPYNNVVQFGSDSWVRFEHFELRYVGERPLPVQLGSDVAHARMFDVSSAEGIARVEWTGAVGKAAPKMFRVGEKNFYLELDHTLLPGSPASAFPSGHMLGETELVVLTSAKHKALLDAFNAASQKR